MIETAIGDRLYKVHKPTLGTQMMVLSKYKDETEQFRTLKIMESCIKIETAAGTGVFRSLKTEEFNAFDDDTFQPLRRAFRDLRGLSNAKAVVLSDFLELFPDAPLEIQAWAQTVKEQEEGKDPLA